MSVSIVERSSTSFYFAPSLLISLLFHFIFLMWFAFKPETIEKKTPKTIDVSFVTLPSKKAPEKPKLFAAENQQGHTENNSIKPQPPRQTTQLPQLKPVVKKAVQKITPPQEVVKTPNVLVVVESEKKIPKLTKKKSEPKLQETVNQSSENEQEKEEKPKISPELLQQQIAQLGTDVRLNQQHADDPKVKFIESVSSQKYIAAQYLKDFESKVERVGLANYPEKHLSGTLTVDVGIKADGSIYSIRVSQSSGNPELDEAAKKIVRLSAPFPPLPFELLKELDVLVITRVWKFRDETIDTSQ